MSVEQRILNFIEEGCDKPSWEGKELRAIALEVRKREDRIKQLEDRIKRLEEAHAVDDASSLATMLAYEIALAKIKRLEDIIKRASIAFFRDGSDGHVASQMLQILEEERNKP